MAAKLYVAKDGKGRYYVGDGMWSKDINKASVMYKRIYAINHGIPVRVSIVEAKDD